MPKIKVAVSPFYGGEDWTDELTGITFSKSQMGVLSTYEIPVEGVDLTNIRRAVRLNALILLEGDLAPEEPVKNLKEESKQEVKEEAKEEVKEEVKEEKPKVDAPKSKVNKRK